MLTYQYQMRSGWYMYYNKRNLKRHTYRTATDTTLGYMKSKFVKKGPWHRYFACGTRDPAFGRARKGGFCLEKCAPISSSHYRRMLFPSVMLLSAKSKSSITKLIGFLFVRNRKEKDNRKWIIILSSNISGLMHNKSNNCQLHKFMMASYKISLYNGDLTTLNSNMRVKRMNPDELKLDKSKESFKNKIYNIGLFWWEEILKDDGSEGVRKRRRTARQREDWIITSSFALFWRPPQMY